MSAEGLAEDRLNLYLRALIAQAKRLQKNKELSMDLEIVAYFCGWTDDHLAPLGRVCLAGFCAPRPPPARAARCLMFGRPRLARAPLLLAITARPTGSIM